MTDHMEEARKLYHRLITLYTEQGPRLEEIATALSAAEQRERERCAKIAESDVPEGFKYGPGMGIAAAIRGAKP